MKIGIYGGTFDPIHLAHMTMVLSVKKSFNLNMVYLVPSKIPPHKEISGGASDIDRLNMVKLAVKELGSDFYVSDFEISSDNISYTYTTALYLRNHFKDDQLYFICGTDIFSSIGTWYNWEQLFNLVNFIVVDRNTKSFDDMIDDIPDILRYRITKDKFINDKYGKIVLYNMEHIILSSTDIRDNLSCEKLSKSVYEYIIENNLYRKGN